MYGDGSVAGGSLGAPSGPDDVTADSVPELLAIQRSAGENRALRRKAVMNDDGPGRWQNDVFVWWECCCAAALTSNLEDATRRDKSRKSKHGMVYECMLITLSKGNDQPGKAVNPARGSAVPSRVSLLISIRGDH